MLVLCAILASQEQNIEEPMIVPSRATVLSEQLPDKMGN
jgi:hypothetical protein